MNKLVITRWKGRMLTALLGDKEVVELGLEEEGSTLGNIYIGRVSRVVQNLNSAFVDFGDGMTGYYSLTDNPASLRPGGETFPSAQLKGGDEILVQVAKDAVKTKDPVLTSNLNFTGKYAVLTTGKRMVGFSSKIHDKAWKEEIRPRLEERTGGQLGVIVRTNGYRMEEALSEELTALTREWERVRADSAYRSCGSLLYRTEPEYLKSLKGTPAGSLEEIVTDQRDIYDTLKAYFAGSQPEEAKKLRLYADPMVSLMDVYCLKTALDQACQKRVWLKSGGYLVIEITEAMVVVDVNTGKYAGKKNLDDTIRMINREAARELCRQLRLRNLSGIILVDFIDMKREEDKALLLEELRAFAAQDPVKTSVVDMTRLNLVEMTRKKGKKPLWEQLQG